MKRLLPLMLVMTLPMLVISQNENPLERVIGYSTFDQQSPSSVSGKIKRINNDSIVVVWNFSADQFYNSIYADLGTGYAFFNGTSWYDDPQARVETVRNYSPNIITLANGKELIISNSFNGLNSEVLISSRPYIGSGPWTESTNSLPSPTQGGNTSVKVISGGADGNSIHLLSLTFPTSQGGTEYQGMDGAILYSRSTNGGLSWDMQHVLLPGMGSSDYTGFRPDDYSWANSKGDTIAFVVGGMFQDIFLMKSVDNGSTWTKTLVYQFPIALFDLELHLVNDPTFTGDGTVAVILDSAGKAHAFFGGLHINNDDTADYNIFSMYPRSCAMYHWRENYGINLASPMTSWHSYVAPTPPDLIEDISEGYPYSFNTQPSAGLDADGNIYLVYSGVVDSLLDFDGYHYRHVYITKSTDGGVSWSEPVDLNYVEEDSYREAASPTLAFTVDDYLHIVYQRDYETGMIPWPTMQDYYPYPREIVYVKVAKSLELGTPVSTEENTMEHILVYPNPSSGRFKIQFADDAFYKVQLFDVLGNLVWNKAEVKQYLEMEMENMAQGTYVLRATSYNHSFSRRVIIK